MLKVVGASWEKTRLTTIMLGTVTVIAIFAIFFFEVPLDRNDGNYAATVYWSKQGGFSFKFWGQGNEPESIKPGVARAYYRPDMTSSGWATLEIQSQSNYPDWVQAHSAGLLEGSLCWQLIFWHWQNTVAYSCESRREFCLAARNFLKENSEKVRKMAIHESKTDPMWHQVNLFYAQLDGLELGWRYGVTRSRKQKEIDIPKIDFLWMNAVSDLKDLELKFNVSKDLDLLSSPLSISLLKLLQSPNSKQKFLLAHSSGGYYTEMLRIQKKYTFGFHMTSDNRSGLVPGHSIQFTSYPAAIHSQDDFYQVNGADNKFIISGTSIRNYNFSLWNKTDTNKLLMGPRVMAANRISLNGSEWGKIVDLTNCGTGIKQWVVLKPCGKNVRMWLVEQIPGKTIVQEQTDTLHKNGYWASWGLPYNEELIKEIGYEEASKVSDISNFFKKVESLLHAGQSNVTDVDSMVHLMRGPDLAIVGRSDIRDNELTMHKNSNISHELMDILTDTTKTFNYTKYLEAIRNSSLSNDTFYLREKRKDLLKHLQDHSSATDSHKVLAYYEKLKMLITGTQPTQANPTDNEIGVDNENSNLWKLQNGGILEKKLNGNIDLKITAEEGNFQATAGPPYTENNGILEIEPFQWSKSLFKDIPHYGQSDIWNFQAMEPKWVWH